MPTDADGFLPRQCPNCQRKFSVHGDTYEEEHYLNLRCPYCGWVEEFDQFLTEEQAEYGETVAENEARRIAEEELKDALEDTFNGVSNDFIEIETNTGDLDFGERSAPSPHLPIETQQIKCSECGFRYLISQEENQNSVSCPVCR